MTNRGRLTSGRMIAVGPVVENMSDNGPDLCACIYDADNNDSYCNAMRNAERIAFLWNAAKGLTDGQVRQALADARGSHR